MSQGRHGRFSQSLEHPLAQHRHGQFPQSLWPTAVIAHSSMRLIPEASVYLKHICSSISNISVHLCQTMPIRLPPMYPSTYLEPIGLGLSPMSTLCSCYAHTLPLAHLSTRAAPWASSWLQHASTRCRVSGRSSRPTRALTPRWPRYRLVESVRVEMCGGRKCGGGKCGGRKCADGDVWRYRWTVCRTLHWGWGGCVEVQECVCKRSVGMP